MFERHNKSFKRLIMLLKRVNNLCVQDKKRKEMSLPGFRIYDMRLMCNGVCTKPPSKLTSSCFFTICKRFCKILDATCTCMYWFAAMLQSRYQLTDAQNFVCFFQELRCLPQRMTTKRKHPRLPSIVCIVLAFSVFEVKYIVLKSFIQEHLSLTRRISLFQSNRRCSKYAAIEVYRCTIDMSMGQHLYLSVVFLIKHEGKIIEIHHCL